MTFPANTRTATYMAATTNDVINELREMYTVTIQSADGANLGNNHIATVTIEDDDGKCDLLLLLSALTS